MHRKSNKGACSIRYMSRTHDEKMKTEMTSARNRALPTDTYIGTLTSTQPPNPSMHSPTERGREKEGRDVRTESELDQEESQCKR